MAIVPAKRLANPKLTLEEPSENAAGISKGWTIPEGDGPVTNKPVISIQVSRCFQVSRDATIDRQVAYGRGIPCTAYHTQPVMNAATVFPCGAS